MDDDVTEIDQDMMGFMQPQANSPTEYSWTPWNEAYEWNIVHDAYVLKLIFIE